MNWNIAWNKPLVLRKSSSEAIYEVNLDSIPEEAGIYIFLRSHGQQEQALYIGKAVRLKGRIRSQLNNLKLMKGIQAAPNGTRMLAIGVLQRKQGRFARRSLEMIERGFIQHYLSLGHDILNKAGTSIARHSLVSERAALKRLIPRELFFEK